MTWLSNLHIYSDRIYCTGWNWAKVSHLYMTFMYTEWPMGTDGNLFPLSYTAFIMMNSQQSSGFCSCLSAFISASTFVQKDISPFRENKFPSFPWLRQLSHWPLTTRVQVQSQASLYGICGRQSGTVTGCCTSTSVSLCWYHFNILPRSHFIHLPSTWYTHKLRKWSIIVTIKNKAQVLGLSCPPPSLRHPPQMFNLACWVKSSRCGSRFLTKCRLKSLMNKWPSSLVTAKTVWHFYKKSDIGNGSIWGQYMGVMAAIYTITEQNEFYKPTMF